MKRVPPQSLTWRVEVEPYPAISYNGDGMIVTVEHWTYTAYTAYDGGGEPWQEIEHAGFGAEVGEIRTFARWYSLEELIADPDADPPAWFLDAIRAIEADS